MTEDQPPQIMQLDLADFNAVAARQNVQIVSEATPCDWRPPLFVEDLSGRGITHHLHRQGPRLARATYVGRYEHQYVFGFHHFHGLVGLDGSFNCQDMGRYAPRLEWLTKNQPPPQYVIPRVTKHDAGFSVTFDDALERRAQVIDDSVFLGSPIEPANWGLWLLYGLETASAFVAAGQKGKYLCHASADWQRKLLQFMGVSADRLVQQEGWRTYRCADIALHQYSAINLVPTPTTRVIAETVRSRCRKISTIAKKEKIFVSRRSVTQRVGMRYRGLVNEAELCDAMEAKGFTVIEPELLDFADQVSIFESAKVVAGLGGAGLFNVLFCNENSKVITIESNEAFVHNHAALFGALRLDYGVIFGKHDSTFERYPHNPWSIDVHSTIDRLSKFI
jgi:hypothetical protein